MSTISKTERTIKLFDSFANALKDIQRRKGILSFICVLIGICAVIVAVFGVLVAFPPAKGLVDVRLVKYIVLEICFFFPHTISLAILTSILGVNNKSNSSLMILILIFDVLMWALMVLMGIFLSVLTR